MIGHYLLSLTPVQEGRVLTRRFGPLMSSIADCDQCLVMAALGVDLFTNECARTEELHQLCQLPAYRYEALCRRFTSERINAAIRNRILANQARRALRSIREDDPHPIEAA